VAGRAEGKAEKTGRKSGATRKGAVSALIWAVVSELSGSQRKDLAKERRDVREVLLIRIVSEFAKIAKGNLLKKLYWWTYICGTFTVPLS
jgi:hypothetical protein